MDYASRFRVSRIKSCASAIHSQYRPHRAWQAQKLLLIGAASLASVVLSGCGGGHKRADTTVDPAVVAQGKTIFRFDTFGDETKFPIWRSI